MHGNVCVVTSRWDADKNPQMKIGGMQQGNPGGLGGKGAEEEGHRNVQRLEPERRVKEVLKGVWWERWGQSRPELALRGRRLTLFLGIGSLVIQVLCHVCQALIMSNPPVTDGLITSNFKKYRGCNKNEPSIAVLWFSSNH